jgi:urease accessory protein
MVSSKTRLLCKGQPITHPAIISAQGATAVQPRAIGAVNLQVKSVGGRSKIRDLRQSGSLKCLFPHNHGAINNAVLINTAGGITGGDSMCFTGHAEPGTTLTVTTQAAERAYRATGQEMGQVTNTLHVEQNAQINWIPQETILFENSALSRSTCIDLHTDARLLFCEPLVFGRLAMKEQLRSARFHDRVEITRGGTPLYVDAVQINGDIHAHLDRPFIANGARAMANLIYIAPNASAHLDPIRAVLPSTGGASMLADDVLTMRLLAADSYELRQTLVPILRRVLHSDLPRCWMI